MSRVAIIEVLLAWIEDHLEQSLSIDEVAKKSGYSKWHLQRIFKDVTGLSIGAYTRGRRLSRAAIALRLTSRSILDIAAQYHFDSQQTFTRAFKLQFGETPARYRRAEDWYTQGIFPPIRVHNERLPEHHIVKLDDMTLIGNTTSYHCRLEQVSACRSDIREKFWQQLLKKSKRVPAIIYGLHQVQPSYLKSEEQEVFYSSAIRNEDLALNVNVNSVVELRGGDYIKFTYRGQLQGLQSFILLLYNTCMPLLGIIRKSGQDIECFYTRQQIWTAELPEEIHCDYFIPVRLENNQYCESLDEEQPKRA